MQASEAGRAATQKWSIKEGTLNSGFPVDIEKYSDQDRKDVLKSFAAYQMKGVNTTDRMRLGNIPTAIADSIAEQTGINASAFDNYLLADGLRHGDEHKNKAENVPVTPDDVSMLYEILEKPDTITVTKKRSGEISVKVTKAFDNKITYVATLGAAKGWLFTKNIWKNKMMTPNTGQMLDASALTPEAAANDRSPFNNSISTVSENSNKFSLKTSTEETEAEQLALADDTDMFMDALEGKVSIASATGDATADSIETVVRHSINPSFGAKYDAWDGKNSNTRFFLGETSQALHYIGVKRQGIVWDASKIIKIKQEHPAMTDEIIKRVPYVIENPIIVMESKTVSGRVTMFGELEDDAGAPVLVVLEIEPTNGHGLSLNVVKIASAYGKEGDLQKYVNSSRVLYVEPDKKKAQTWLKLYRLQLPSSVKYGLNGRITHVKSSVKSSIRSDEEKSAENSNKFSLKTSTEETEAEQLALADDTVAPETPEAAALRRELELARAKNAEQAKIIETLKSEFEITKGYRPKTKSLESLAGRILGSLCLCTDVGGNRLSVPVGRFALFGRSGVPAQYGNAPCHRRFDC